MGADLSDAGAADEGSLISAINVTPFVDVVLVLLVIFMVTAPALMKDVLGLQLPKARSADQKAVQSLGVAVTRQGQLLVNGVASSPEQLSLEVKKLVAISPDASIVISADHEAKHGDVVRAVDLVKSAGGARFAFQIDRQN